MKRAFRAGIMAMLLPQSVLASTPEAATLPPYSTAYQPRGVDEIGAWQRADESERLLANSPIVIRDPALNAYVRDVLCRTVGADRCNSVRLYILRTPLFNASMEANGTMRVYSGLLLRVRNEAELGAVLGHEFGHFEARHTVAGFKAARGASDYLSWLAVLSAAAAAWAGGVPSGSGSYRNAELSVYGDLYRFNRDQERAADRLGIGYLNASPLRPQSAARVWQNLMAETEASAAAKGLSRPRFDRVLFFATHPPEAERAATLAALSRTEGATRDDGAERYRQNLAPWLPGFLDDQVKLNDFGASDYLITALAENGWTAPLWRARGDLYRARGNPRDLVNAADFYTKAVALDPNLAEARRGLGLALLKTGQASEGQPHLRRYLELKPDAPDASMIRMLAGSTEDEGRR